MRARSSRRSGPHAVGSRPSSTLPGHVEVVEEVQFLVDERDAVARWPSERRASRRARRRSAPLPNRAARCRRRSSSAWTCRRRSRRARATTSPACTSRLTPRSACTPGKRFWMPRSWRTGAPMCRVTLAQRPRSSSSFVRNSSTLFCRDHHRRHEHLAAGRNAGSVAREGLGQERHRLVAELERLLHDGADDRAGLDARERLVVFVEGDDLHLADLVRRRARR